MRALLLALALLAAASAPAVRILDQQARWTGPGTHSDLGDDREPWFLISGELQNQGSQPLAHVRIVYELLAGGVVVAREFGYNRRAEALRDPAVESGRINPASLALPPLGAGERDGFRMLFLRADAPRFDSWRVRIDAVAPLASPTP